MSKIISLVDVNLKSTRGVHFKKSDWKLLTHNDAKLGAIYGNHENTHFIVVAYKNIESSVPDIYVSDSVHIIQNLFGEPDEPFVLEWVNYQSQLFDFEFYYQKNHDAETLLHDCIVELN